MDHFRTFMNMMLVALFVMLFASCNLEYQNANFKLEIAPNGSGQVEIFFRDIGSVSSDDKERKKDVAILRSIAVDDKYIAEAAKHNVKILKRSLSYTSYSVGLLLAAESNDYKNLFEILSPLYKFKRTKTKIYIIPVNQSIIRANVAEPGKLVKHKGEIAFRWPAKDAKILSFTSEYTTKGDSFRKDLQKRFGSE
ncbi:MAG: hypothetical protein ACN4E2_00870 [Nitrospinota bacterium]